MFGRVAVGRAEEKDQEVDSDPMRLSAADQKRIVRLSPFTSIST
jgi:hypothetical protein